MKGTAMTCLLKRPTSPASTDAHQLFPRGDDHSMRSGEIGAHTTGEEKRKKGMKWSDTLIHGSQSFEWGFFEGKGHVVHRQGRKIKCAWAQA